MSHPAHRTIDRTRLIEALVVMAFAVILFAVTFSFKKVPPILAQGIQPTVFPRAILAIMFGLGVIQAVTALRPSAEELEMLKPKGPIPLIVVLTAALLIGFVALMPVIGTFPALVLFLPALSLLWGERRWRLMALSFAGFAGFVYLLFRLIMNVPLP